MPHHRCLVPLSRDNFSRKIGTGFSLGRGVEHLREFLQGQEARDARALSILVLEDDQDSAARLCRILHKEGWTTRVADEIAGVEPALRRCAYDLMIFDVDLPDGNGLDLLRRLRHEGYSTPILILTGSHHGDEGKIEVGIASGLDLGADEYVTKPFNEIVLLSRIRALIRRSEREGRVSCGRLQVQFEGNSAFVGLHRLALLQRDLNVLGMLAWNYPDAVTKEVLFRRLWPEFVNRAGRINNSRTNPIEVAISTLRGKLEAQVFKPAAGLLKTDLPTGQAAELIVSIPPPKGRGAKVLNSDDSDPDLERAWKLAPEVLTAVDLNRLRIQPQNA